MPEYSHRHHRGLLEPWADSDLQLKPACAAVPAQRRRPVIGPVRPEERHSTRNPAIVGMRPFDPANTVIFRPMQIGTTMHEFCHSFANPIVDKYVGTGFVWTEDTSNFLKQYEANRDQYPTFESFFPELVAFLNEYTARAQ